MFNACYCQHEHPVAEQVGLILYGDSVVSAHEDISGKGCDYRLGNTFICSFEHRKQSATQFHYIGEKAKFSAADI